jgi:hypothetical protein
MSAAQACWKLGLPTARVAVAGLNPHAGEGGEFGDEEQTMIGPAVESARRNGHDAHGPFAADALFHHAFRGDYDIVVAMYHDQGLAPLKMIASEIEFALPLRNAKGRKTGSYIAGKIDGIGRWNNELAVVEHKTTSDNIEPGSDYWRRLAIDQQISLYYYAAPELGFDVATVLYDVIRKPTIRLRKAETPAEYGVRLAADIAERPAYYYCRREIPRLRADLDEAMNEVRHMDLLLRHARRNNAWPRNTAVCVFPYRCEFFNLCCNGYDPAAGVPSGYVQLTTPHPELPNVP